MAFARFACTESTSVGMELAEYLDQLRPDGVAVEYIKIIGVVTKLSSYHKHHCFSKDFYTHLILDRLFNNLIMAQGVNQYRTVILDFIQSNLNRPARGPGSDYSDEYFISDLRDNLLTELVGAGSDCQSRFKQLKDKWPRQEFASIFSATLARRGEEIGQQAGYAVMTK